MNSCLFFNDAERSKGGLIRLFGTIILVFLGIAIGQVPLLVVLSYLGAGALSNASLSLLNENIALILMIISFGTGLLALGLGATRIHGQSFRSLITPFSKLDWRRLLLSFVIWFSLAGVCEIFFYLRNPDIYQWSFSAKDWFPLFVIALVLLPIQTSFEEILIRGYLLQRLGLLFNNRWAALVLTSLLFGALHLANPEVAAFGMEIMMIYYVGMGLFLGLCTLLDQRLEIALGVHAATNFYGATMVTFKESAIQTPAMFTVSDLDATWMTGLFGLSALFFFTYFGRRYQWAFRSQPSFVRSEPEL